MSRETRRKFLERAALGTAALTLGPWKELARGQRMEGDAGGLLFDEGDKDRMLRTVRHRRFAPFWKTYVDANLDDDMKFLREELRLTSHVYDMARARKILERTAFVYALTGDAQQRAVATTAMEKILAYPAWDYFLEGGEHSIGLQRAPEATIAMAMALDCLGNSLNPETRLEVEHQIAEKGAPACFRTLWGMLHPDRVRGWTINPESDYAFRFTLDLARWPVILNSTNLKVIPIAGLGIAACVLWGKHPQAVRWLDMAVQSARAFAPMFGRDGSYEEGVSYWGYTALHLALLAEVLSRRRGVELKSLINFPGTIRYALQMSMPTTGRPGDCVNFGDASTVGDTSVASWVARTFRDEISQYVALEIGEVTNHYAIAWYDETVEPKKPGPELYDVRFANDWVVSRTGWDAGSTVVAMRSGLPANHEHADRNSIVMKSRGERLIHDPFKASYSYTEPAWLLRQTEAHSALLINGRGHQYHNGKEGTNSSWAEARITHYEAQEGFVAAVSDATDAYRLVDTSVSLAERTIVFAKPDVLVIFDRVLLKSPGRVQARFQIYNEDGKGVGVAREDRFVIQRPFASLNGVVKARGKTAVKSGKLDLPADKGVFPFIEVESADGTEHEIVMVCSVTAPGTDGGEVNIESEGGGWRVIGSQKGKTFHVVVTPGKQPKVK